MSPEERRQLEDVVRTQGSLKMMLDSLTFTMRQLFPTLAGYFSGGQNFSMRFPNLSATPANLPFGSGLAIVGYILKRWNGSSWVPAAGNFTIQMQRYDALPQTANNFYGSEWIAPFACKVISIRETHKDAASGALTLDVRKNSTTLLASQFDLNGGGGDVITVGSLTATTADLNFAIGDRLTWAVSGSVAGIRGVHATVEFQPT